MRVQWGIDKSVARPSCLALGVFDGVHLGHRKVIAAAVRQARASGIVPAVLTFEPHPGAVVIPSAPLPSTTLGVNRAGPAGAPPLLTTTEEKLALLRELGVKLVVVARFDRSLANMPPEDFIAEVLVRRLRARCVVVGADWRFGSGGRGTAALLRQVSPRHGCHATIVPPVNVEGKPVSSTRIRKLLLRGKVEEANGLLGRPYSVQGRVVRAHGLGRKLGFPTANLQLALEKLVPADGVYACWAGPKNRRVEESKGGVGTPANRLRWPAVCYVGTRPTVESGGARRVEVHLLERRGPVGAPGASLRAQLVSRLRPERRFASLGALVAQLRADSTKARVVLGALQKP
jgi:riboflavin kinase/FMN adenylyltransferase